jgi:hypothetical protein
MIYPDQHYPGDDYVPRACLNDACPATDVEERRKCAICESDTCESCSSACSRCEEVVCNSHLKDMANADDVLHFDRYKRVCEPCIQYLIEDLQFILHGAPVEVAA